MKLFSACFKKKPAKKKKYKHLLKQYTWLRYERAKEIVFSTNLEQQDKISATLIFYDNCPVGGKFSASEKVIIRQAMHDLNTYLRILLKICNEYQRLEPDIRDEYRKGPVYFLPDLRSIAEVQSLHDIIIDPSCLMKIIDGRGHDCIATAMIRDEHQQKIAEKLENLRLSNFAGDDPVDYQVHPGEEQILRHQAEEQVQARRRALAQEYGALAQAEAQALGYGLLAQLLAQAQAQAQAHPHYQALNNPNRGEIPSSSVLSTPFLTSNKLANLMFSLKNQHKIYSALEDQRLKLSRNDDFSYRLGLVKARQCLNMPEEAELFALSCTNNELYLNPDSGLPGTIIRIGEDVLNFGLTRSLRAIRVMDKFFACHYFERMGCVFTARDLFKDLIVGDR